MALPINALRARNRSILPCRGGAASGRAAEPPSGPAAAAPAAGPPGPAGRDRPGPRLAATAAWANASRPPPAERSAQALRARDPTRSAKQARRGWPGQPWRGTPIGWRIGPRWGASPAARRPRHSSLSRQQ
ncbi:MAG: hypothetical protein FJ049_08200 [Cyanobacteria bacterium M_surface_7_m2_037]|nr:hypothetical protein [Cyanobacteria bacterium M_surface_7_m2_037]MBM5820416.1 hypothetical protein [Cyanobacteria bacterium K_DeepCast_150m_m2_101]